MSTGQYPHRWRITSYLNNRADNAARGMADWLDPRAPSLARLLKDAGYATGHFGKWHMGGQRDVGEAPLISAYGFDESLTNFEGLGPRVLPLLDAHDGKPPRKHALGSDNLGRGDIVWKDRAEVTPAFVAAAIDFIRRSAAAGRPFYVNLWPDDVHSPFFPAAGRRGDGAKRTLYHAVLETMDAQLGPLFEEIRANPKLHGNTFVLVCSDNGPEVGAGSAGGLRGSKAMLYEGGIRSPLVVWGPGWIAGARVGTADRESVIAAIDLAPSLLAIAGVQPPVDVGFDGVARHDVLLGTSAPTRARPLFFRRPPDRGSFSGVADLPDLAVVDGNWKLLCEYDGSAAELYDLATDAAESVSRVGAHPAVAARLSSLVREWHHAMPPDHGATYRAPAATPQGKKRSAP
ncbi:MAG: N-acetylgalactosamine-6-sulfatase [Candidatus Hydrogenedentes bacterium]|nr:N-acetylgalactosamine-6-sulfatase [Candidatus Hydrogenedentota bacterium]